MYPITYKGKDATMTIMLLKYDIIQIVNNPIPNEFIMSILISTIALVGITPFLYSRIDKKRNYRQYGIPALITYIIRRTTNISGMTMARRLKLCFYALFVFCIPLCAGAFLATARAEIYASIAFIVFIIVLYIYGHTILLTLD